MSTMIRENVFVQLRNAQDEIRQLTARVKFLSTKCFNLNNERAKWEHRYKQVKARLDRLTIGPEQFELYTSPNGSKVTSQDVERYRAAMNPQAEFTVAQVAAWLATEGIL